MVSSLNFFSYGQFKFNKTGLQPVSRPVEQILGFFPKDLKSAKNGANIIKHCQPQV